MKIKYVKAKNFLSIGDEGIEINFDNYGNIVVVKGFNLDVHPQGSNGAGKSTLVECIVYGFFGKLIKGLPHKEAINKKTKKGLEVEIAFDDYRIVRRRKPDSLELYEGGKNVTLGGMPATQQAIEDLIGLNYEAFINIVCFGEHNNHAFLACDAATKRAIVENLLGLEKYVKYMKTAREMKHQREHQLQALLKRYEGLSNAEQAANTHLKQVVLKQSQWKEGRKREIMQLTGDILTKRDELANLDEGDQLLYYKECQTKIQHYNSKLVTLEDARSQLVGLFDETQAKLNAVLENKHSLSMRIKDQERERSKVDQKIADIQHENDDLNSLQDGVKCTRCRQVIDKGEYQSILLQNANMMQSLTEQRFVVEQAMSKLTLEWKNVDEKVEKLKAGKKAIEEKQADVNKKLAFLRSELVKLAEVKEPKAGAQALLLENTIATLEKQKVAKEKELEGGDPYVEIIVTTQAEIDKVLSQMEDCTKEISKVELEIPYYDFWIKGFGDEGIRSFIIDGILPALNARINYWLQFLIDNKIQLRFDKQFDATIERNPPDGDPFVYNATSGGERRRINLAISQAFAHVMMLSSGTCPSLISLDEVALNVDLPGVYGIYKMICELARDRQVLVTTHDQNLLDLLATADEITVVKKDGFTKLQESV